MYSKVEFNSDRHSAVLPRLDDAIAVVLQQEITNLEAAPLPTRIAMLLARHANGRDGSDARKLTRLTTEGAERSGAMALAMVNTADLAAG